MLAPGGGLVSWVRLRETERNTIELWPREERPSERANGGRKEGAEKSCEPVFRLQAMVVLHELRLFRLAAHC